MQARDTEQPVQPWPHGYQRYFTVALCISGGFAVILVVQALGVWKLAETYERSLLQAASVVAGGLLALGVRERPTERGAWRLVGLGIGLRIIGDALAAALPDHPVPPAPLDGLAIVGFVLIVLGVFSLVRARLLALSAMAWPDFLAAFAGGGAIVMGAALRPILDAADEANVSRFATVYPVFNLIILGLLISAGSLRPWRLDRATTLLFIGLALFAAVDLGRSLLLTSGGYNRGNWLALATTASYILIAASSLYPTVAGPYRRALRNDELGVPVRAAMCSTAVLVVSAFVGTSGQLHPVAPGLATIGLVVTLVRFVSAQMQIGLLSVTRTEARTDDLTGLPNRRCMNEELTARLAADPFDTTALLVIDLDRFKDVNDSFGHDMGDAVLKGLKPRLVSAAESFGADAFRLGGDEFAVVMSHSSVSDALALAKLIEDRVRLPLEAEGITVSISASVGIAFAPWHARTTSDLFRVADKAMYESKRRRRGPIVYDEAWDTNSTARVERLAELQSAVFDDELVVAYQPMLETSTRRFIGAEALVRWNHPVHGLLSPSSFIDLADPAGRSSDLTRVVLDRALAACVEWRKVGSGFAVSVNITARDIEDVGFIARVRDSLAEHCLPGDALTLEVPESMIGAELERAMHFFGQLRAAGVGLSIDDYGAGVAGIGQLARLPATELKIDRSLVAGLLGDRRSEAIVRSTVELARSLGLDVVAEGVEDLVTLEYLVALGCERVQGFAVGRETTAAGIDRLLAGQL